MYYLNSTTRIPDHVMTKHFIFNILWMPSQYFKIKLEIGIVCIPVYIMNITDFLIILYLGTE